MRDLGIHAYGTRLAVALGVAALLAGCGVFGSSSSSTSSTSQAGGGAQPAPKPPKPVAAPKAKQSVQEAEKQIAKLSASNNCKTVYKLNPIGARAGLNNPARCQQLQGLAGLQADGAASYKGGAVIDYALGIRTLSVVLVRDSDGRLRVAFPDYFLPRPSVGTKLAPEFDGAARRAVKALRTHDCSLFTANALQELGPVSAGDQAACDFAKNNAIATVFSGYPQARIERLGGDANVAFYGVGGPGGFFTLVFARETPSDYLPATKPLSKKAPEYGFATLYLTGKPPKAKSQPKARTH